jgi:hypothetical protein
MEIDALSTEVAQMEKELAELGQQLADAKAEENNLHHREEIANRILSMQDIGTEEDLVRAQRKSLVALCRIIESKLTRVE